MKERETVINTQPEIKTMKVKDLKPAPYNPRTIEKQELEGLKASLKRFGLVEPIVWNKRTGYVVGGHQRLKALQEERITDSLVVVVDLSDDDEQALNITLNNPKAQGRFDEESVSRMLEELKPKMPEFEALNLQALLDTMKTKDEKIEEDDVPDPPEDTFSKPGDVWILGEHRLVCGDCTKQETWDRMIAGAKASLVFTDPPYGVSYKAASGKHEIIMGDKERDDALINNLLLPAFKMAVKNAKDTASFYIWHASPSRDDFAYALKAARLQELQYLIWAKPSAVLGWADYQWSHEPCFYAVKAGNSPDFYGDRTNTTVWRVGLKTSHEGAFLVGNGILLVDGKGGKVFITNAEPKNKKIRRVRIEEGQTIAAEAGGGAESCWEIGRESGYKHPTQKPVELARRGILNSSKPGDIVVDMFLGSGCTLMACEETGRKCFGSEMDPKHVDVIATRWMKWTGRKAMLERENAVTEVDLELMGAEKGKK